MKIVSKNLFLIVSGLLLLVSILGTFDKQAFEFVKGVSEKNVSFLALVMEIKLVLSSVTEVNIPFVSGDTKAITASMDKAENYLLITSVISFIQLLFLAISKSWIVKIGMLILFGLCFFKPYQKLSSKILILALALSPGLSIYSTVVQKITQEASINFGTEYLKEMEQKVAAIKAEKSELMKEHAQQINQINNGEKGVVLFKKLSEDVSYDLKKSAVSIKGDYQNIRLLIKKGSHTIYRKLFAFCTMVLFCLFILPMGYSLIIYVLYAHLFPNSPLAKKAVLETKKLEGDLENKSTLYKRLGNALIAAKKEFKVKKRRTSIEKVVEQKLGPLEQKAEVVESKLEQKILTDEKQQEKKSRIDINQELSLEKHHIDAIVEQLHQKLVHGSEGNN